MFQRRFRIQRSAVQRLQSAYDELASDLPHDFPAQVLEETRSAIHDLADPFATGRDGLDSPKQDYTHIPFVTIDPPGARDLDQAMYLSQASTEADTFTVMYAIADVGRFIEPGGPLDQETRTRGQTIYLPDRKIPLHPKELSEDAASLLPEQTRSAYVFTAKVATDGKLTDYTLERAVVRSRAQLDYTTVQHQWEQGQDLHPSIALLPQVGEALLADARTRGAIDLAIPDQEVTDTLTLQYRPRGGIEDFNAQISLLAGRIAAQLQIQAETGILRTLNFPDEETVEKFHAIVRTLGFEPRDTYQETLRSIDHLGNDPRALAVHYASPMLFRGAGYTLVGTDPDPVQAAVGAPYAHATAPLRRLVDRFVLPIAEAAARNAPTPSSEGLEDIISIMKSSGSITSRIDKDAIDRTEALLLADRIGEEFTGVVVGRKTRDDSPVNTVHVPDPAVVVDVADDAQVGQEVRIRLESIHNNTPVFTIADHDL
ncbi:RNB domain-containing ribonuclease [Brevibacterium sp. UMB1308A]|uniref:ribonuclease catalytic domain-containing protein n=1 Tax=Brevibacterium sp. UMB1308A TaxID=3050608 RepID=UPI00254EEBC4|nr:RNB domain-containing ribonuclease [Brevibacterium sp. UMB1308A]MDK8345765.1 RNB domain-containing ribonuclease [Brevibacterium sp. UMB1308B]MDK8714540.1 RNB domain-containing ribonuclease [Brevibacterium sp. UMB1308A]